MKRAYWSSAVPRAVGIFMAICLLAGCSSRTVATAPPEGPDKLKNAAAPDFSAQSVDGKTVTLASLKGNVVVMDFWATWCPPCRKSLPHIQELSQDGKLAARGLKVMTVNSQEEKDKVASFLKENSYTFPTLLDPDGKLVQAYEADSIPLTVIIGRDGVVKNVFLGFEPDKTGKQVDDAVEAALGGKS